MDAPKHANGFAADLGEKDYLVRRLELRGEELGRAWFRVRAQPPVDRVVRMLAQQRQSERENRRKVLCGCLANRETGDGRRLSGIGNRESGIGVIQRGAVPRRAWVEGRLAAIDSRFPIPDSLSFHADIPPPKRSWFGRRRCSCTARPYRPASVREIFFRATSASSTSSQAAAVIATSFFDARPTSRTISRSVGTDAKPFTNISAEASSVTSSAPPTSNHITTSSAFTTPARSRSVASAARRINSRAIAWPPMSSPSYSSSIFPVIDGIAA